MNKNLDLVAVVIGWSAISLALTWLIQHNPDYGQALVNCGIFTMGVTMAAITISKRVKK